MMAKCDSMLLNLFASNPIVTNATPSRFMQNQRKMSVKAVNLLPAFVLLPIENCNWNMREKKKTERTIVILKMQTQLSIRGNTNVS